MAGSASAATASEHPPAIELYISRRYFATTWEAEEGAPDDLRTVDLATLRWLITEAGPAFVGAAKKPGSSSSGGGKDQSRSAIAFRKGAELRRNGANFSEMVAVLRADPETADWVREKGDAYRQRELRRIWERAEETTETDDGRRIIRVSGAAYVANAEAAELAIMAAGLPVFRRAQDQQLVRPLMVDDEASEGRKTTSAALAPITDPMMRQFMQEAACLRRNPTHGPKNGKRSRRRPISRRLSSNERVIGRSRGLPG